MPRKKKGIIIKEQQVDPDAIPLSKLIRDMGAKERKDAEDSVIGKLIPIAKHPSILIYGPSKTGKTRISMWEAAAIAKVYNKRVLGIYTEPNMESDDFMDLISICIYHDVACELVKQTELPKLRRYVFKLKRTVEHAMKKKPEELKLIPRVYVFDSITSLSEKVSTELSDQMLDNTTALVAAQNPYQANSVVPLREIVAEERLNGYLILTAQETQTRGVPYNPAVPAIKAKPRYTSSTRYKEDAEIYFSDNIVESLRTCEETKSGGWRIAKQLISVTARRTSDVGRGVAIVFDKIQVQGVGVLERIWDYGSLIYRYIPESLLKEEENLRGEYKDVKPVKITGEALVPKIVCGPKKI